MRNEKVKEEAFIKARVECEKGRNSFLTRRVCARGFR